MTVTLTVTCPVFIPLVHVWICDDQTLKPSAVTFMYIRFVLSLSARHEGELSRLGVQKKKKKSQRDSAQSAEVSATVHKHISLRAEGDITPVEVPKRRDPIVEANVTCTRHGLGGFTFLSVTTISSHSSTVLLNIAQFKGRFFSRLSLGTSYTPHYSYAAY